MEIYLVGGAVRDQLLKIPVVERDYVVVGATREQMLQLGFKQVGKDFPVFLHPLTNEEYALARTERKKGKGYTGFECFADVSVSLEEDLKRRDLTINAMALSEDGKIIDPYGGQQDLENKILRHVSDAFVEDPLRILRVARFSAKFPAFKIAPATLRLMKNMVYEIDALVPERVWQEWRKAFKTECPFNFIKVLRKIGALDKLFPELAPFYKQIRDNLKLISKKIIPNRVLGAIFSAVPLDNLKLFFRHYKVSKLEQNLARNLVYFQRLAVQSSADDILDILEKLDSFRYSLNLKSSLNILRILIPYQRSLFAKVYYIYKVANQVKITKEEVLDIPKEQIRYYVHTKRLDEVNKNLQKISVNKRI